MPLKVKELLHTSSLEQLSEYEEPETNFFKKTGNVHMVGYVASCRFCRKTFKTLEETCNHKCSKFDSHKITHKCNLCGIMFKRKIHLDRHLKGHKRNNCNYCGAQFTKRKELCKHMKTEHDINEPEKIYMCTFCNKSFVKKSSLNIHRKKHANGKPICTMCGTICEDKAAYAEHIKEHFKNSKYECQLCDKKFLRCQQYTQHMAGHEKHVCAPCNETFSTKKLLHKHKQKVHGAKIIKNHQCEICGKCFDRPLHLVVHQRIHTGEKPVKCQHCNKNYHSKETLAKHMKTVRHLQKVHKNGGEEVRVEKKFSCEKCGAKFYRFQTLTRHVELTHTYLEPFKCEHCEYYTKCKANLKRHSELHSQIKRYSCEVCGQAFRALSTLKEHHVFIHTKNRDYLCDLCSKSFKNNSDLQRHRKIHSDDRPYKCSCNRSYKRLSHLKRHMETAKHNVDSLSNYTQTGESMKSLGSSKITVETLEDSQDSSCDDFIPEKDDIGVVSNSLLNNNSLKIFDKGNSFSNISNKENDYPSFNVTNKGDNNISVSQNNMQIFLDTIQSKKVTDFPLVPIEDPVAPSISPIITLTDLATSENITVPLVTGLIEQPISTVTNLISSDHVTVVEAPFLAFTNKISPESTVIVEQPSVKFRNDISSENKSIPISSVICEQPKGDVYSIESQLPNGNIFENSHANLNTNVVLQFPYDISNLLNQANANHSPILHQQDSSQFILSINSVQNNPAPVKHMTIMKHPLSDFTHNMLSENTTIVEQSGTSNPPLHELTEQSEATTDQTESEITIEKTFENEHVNLVTNSYCLYNIPSLLSPMNVEQSSVLQHQNSSEVTLSVTPAQENPSRPHSLPNFSFQSIDSCDNFTINTNNTSNSISHPLFFDDLPPPSDLNIDQSISSKQLFGESGDILVYNSDCSAQLNLPLVDAEMWDVNSNRLTVSTDGVVENNVSGTIFTTVPNIVENLPININSFVFCNEQIINNPVNSSYGFEAFK